MTALSEGLLKLTAAGLICGGLLSVAAGAHKEILRFGCGCLVVIVLLSIMQKSDIADFDLAQYSHPIQAQVDETQRQVRQELLEQTASALEAEILRQTSALGMDCSAQVTCTADPSGMVMVTQVRIEYWSGMRDHLPALQNWITQQLAVPAEAILIQEGSKP